MTPQELKQEKIRIEIKLTNILNDIDDISKHLNRKNKEAIKILEKAYNNLRLVRNSLDYLEFNKQQ